MSPAERQSFEDVRRWASFVIEFRWLLTLLAVVFLIVIGVLGGRSWSGRLLWAGMTLTVVALIFFIAVQVANGPGVTLGRDELDRLNLSASAVDAEFRADFPAMARLLESGKFDDKAEVLVRSFMDQYRNAILPWLAAGAIVSALAIAWRVVRGSGKKKGAGPVTGVAPPATSSTN
jgi:hypothetical protein